MKLLTIYTGTYGDRIAENLRLCAPADWRVEKWRAPAHYPLVIDEPRELLPAELPAADLLVVVGEHPGVAELVPDLCRMTGAHAVIAPIDRSEWLPKGLANQLRGWLEEMGVTAVSPKPFCSLTESTYSLRGERREYSHPLISEFARVFGRPRFKIAVRDGRVDGVEVERGAACGSSLFVADGLRGVRLDDVEFQAGMLHHYHPCLASMDMDPDYNDTLMHVSGNLTRDAAAAAVAPYRRTSYFKPL